MNFSRLIILFFLSLACQVSIAQFGSMGGGGMKADTSGKKLKIAAIPLINYSPSFGGMIGALGMGFYRLNREDTISPPSVTGLMAMYTSNKTWGTVVFQKLYLKEDKYRVTAALGVASVNFQIYSELIPPSGGFIGYSTAALFLYLKGSRKIFPNIYSGLHYIYYRADTKFDLPVPGPETGFNNYHGLGINFEYDSRDNVNNPYSGWHSQLDITFYNEFLGSKNNFNVYEFSVNHYRPVTEKSIIALRFQTGISAGDVPFTGQNVVGGDDIRGYTNGKYRADQVYSLQAEYRWNFYKRFGMVAFMAVATAVNDLSEMTLDGFLPGAGAGIRYMMIKDEQINVGMDIATGKDDWGIYFRISEAF